MTMFDEHTSINLLNVHKFNLITMINKYNVITTRDIVS